MISRNKTRIIMLMLTFMIIVLLTACEKSLLWVGSNVGNSYHASYKLFTGNEVKKIKALSGETMIIDYNSKVKEGSLSMKLYDPDDMLIKEFVTNEVGTEEIIADKDGEYKLEIVGEGTSGSFEVDYKIE